MKSGVVRARDSSSEKSKATDPQNHARQGSYDTWGSQDRKSLQRACPVTLRYGVFASEFGPVGTRREVSELMRPPSS